jgi:hypothetical protein
VKISPDQGNCRLNVVKWIWLRETGFNGGDQVGTSFDVSQGMPSQKRQKGKFQIRLTDLPSEQSARFYISQSSVCGNSR